MLTLRNVSSMKYFEPFIISCIVLFFFHEGTSLRCRSGNQQMDARFQKVLTICKKRYADTNTDNSDESTSTNNNSSEMDSNSEESFYDKNFFDKKTDKSNNQSTNIQRYRNTNRNGNINSSDRTINRNLRHLQNIKHIRKSNDQSSWNSRDLQTGRSNFQNGDTRLNNNTGREQSCIIQCFFNELNAVDQKGFPEKDSVISLMSQNIQDPELKDFVEESIIECFQYLESNKREKCEFSQNLLTCLAEKGQQRCEDWEN